jgi:hypothetical protein
MTSAPSAQTTLSPAAAGVNRLVPRYRCGSNRSWPPPRVASSCGWWPRSRVLVAELPVTVLLEPRLPPGLAAAVLRTRRRRLPGLLAVLALRARPHGAGELRSADWGPTVRQIIFGRGVRLEGFRSQRAARWMCSPPGEQPPCTWSRLETSSRTAQDALMAVARRDNADGVEVLLAGRRAQPSRQSTMRRRPPTSAGSSAAACTGVCSPGPPRHPERTEKLHPPKRGVGRRSGPVLVDRGGGRVRGPA